MVAITFFIAGCHGLIDSNKEVIEGVDKYCFDQSNVGPSPLRRLTNEEYAATVNDLLGVDVADIVVGFPTDGYDHGFDNNADILGISSTRAARYQEAAESIAARVVSQPARVSALTACNLKTDATCLADFITRFGRRAYRRPLTTDEAQGFKDLAAAASSDSDPNATLSYLIQGVLQSPSFLFRPEFGLGAADSDNRVKLSGYELAARLSYLLWGTMPDDALLDAAETGTLDSDGGLASSADRLLADPRAKDRVRNFYEQWLRMQMLDAATPDTTRFQTFSDDLRKSMRQEVDIMLDSVIWNGKDLLTIFNTTTTSIDASLADLYDMTPPNAAGFSSITLPASANRAGILTTAAVLTQTSKSTHTSIMRRGMFLRDAILCDPVKVPPNFMVTPLEVPAGQTENDAILQHASRPECAACHTRLDPIGLGLENYNAIGAYRTQDENNNTISGEGHIEGLDGSTFHGGVELGNLMSKTPAVAQCVTEHFMRWALGRSLVEENQSADGCTKQILHKKFESKTHDFRELIHAFVSDEAFRYRTPN